MATPTPLREVSYRLRRALESDADDVSRLIDRAEDLRQVAPRETFPLDATTVRHWIRDRAAGWVLEQRGETVAYAELVTDPQKGGVFWIGHMMVQRSRRGLGLGQRMVVSLMRAAVEQLDADEIAISAFEDNRAALACYRGCGFVERKRQRVDGRVLVEMRYPVPGRLRRPGRAVTAVLTVAAVGISATLLPWGARFWLLDQAAWISAVLVLTVAAITTGASLLLHPMLPRTGAPLSHRLGRPLAYAMALGVVASLAAYGAVLVFEDRRSVDAFELAWETLASGLRHGAAWGILLLLGSQLLPRMLSRRKRRQLVVG